MSYTQAVKGELKEVLVQKKHCLAAVAFAEELFNTKKEIDKQSIINIELVAEKAKTVLERQCCKRSFLRTAFLLKGMVSDPKGQYHFEIVCQDRITAELVQKTAQSFGPNGHIIERKGRYVFYIKDADEISDMLNICEAYRSLMEFENGRILKEVRNNVNRQVNCETANLQKTIAASARQVEDIEVLKKYGGYETLSPELKATCEARLADPTLSLSELGKMLPEVTSRSGLNHRFQKIHELAISCQKT